MVLARRSLQPHIQLVNVPHTLHGTETVLYNTCQVGHSTANALYNVGHHRWPPRNLSTMFGVMCHPHRTTVGILNQTSFFFCDSRKYLQTNNHGYQRQPSTISCTPRKGGTDQQFAATVRDTREASHNERCCKRIVQCMSSMMQLCWCIVQCMAGVLQCYICIVQCTSSLPHSCRCVLQCV
jgi:hypothetical protein